MDARDLTLQLGGRWHARYGAAPCPACQPERRPDQSALTISDGAGGLLLHCKKSECVYRDILAAAGIAPGTFAAPDPTLAAQRRADELAVAEKRARQARAVWADALPICGTVAEHYLRRARGITCDLPPNLRFAPDAWHLSGKRLPALIARVDGAKGFAVHRTYLREDGAGKADVDPPKAMLGHVAGGAVRLTRAGGALVAAEGIETALSLACGLLRQPATIWAALSTSGLRTLHLPPNPSKLILAADGDAEGIKAAEALAARAYAAGWAVRMMVAPAGTDWNDELRQRAAKAVAA